MRWITSCIMLVVLAAGCGTQQPPRRSSGRANTGGVAPAPVIDPYRDPCWCYTEPEEDAFRITIEAAWQDGVPYQEMMGVITEGCYLSPCGYSGCTTCLIPMVADVYGR